MNKSRFERVCFKMNEAGVSQMILSDPYAIFYLTGQWVETGERLLALYIDAKDYTKSKLLYNSMFTVSSSSDLETIAYRDTDDPIALLSSVVSRNAILGVDKNMPARFLLPLAKQSGATDMLNASHFVDAVRAVKDDEEIRAMRTVSMINDRSMENFKDLLTENVTEIQVAGQLEDIYRKNGADGLAFPPTVDFGADAAISHHASEATPLLPGSCALIDVGCKKDFYCADMTRTFFYKQIDPKHERIYNLVREAVIAAEAVVKPGVRFCDIDRAARQIIEDGGYGPYFTHRLGHFIGLEVHEFGDVSSTNTGVAEPGNIFSIEPGVYLPGEMGIRIEDLVLVTEDGCEILNHYSKDLKILD